MHSSAQSPNQSTKWDDLTRIEPAPVQLNNIKAQLDLILLALEALVAFHIEHYWLAQNERFVVLVNVATRLYNTGPCEYYVLHFDRDVALHPFATN